MSALSRISAIGTFFGRLGVAACVAFGLAVGVGVGGAMADGNNPATNYVPADNVATNNKLDVTEFTLWAPGATRGFSSLLTSIMSFLGMTAVLTAVLGVMVGGFFILFSAGENGMESGKKILITSAIGLAVVMMSYLIVTLLQTFIYSV